MINGIKPKMSKTTELKLKPISFDDAMVKFCDKLNENVKPEVDRFKFMKSVTYKPCGGVKYIKVKYFTDRIDTDYETGVKTIVKDERGSIHCFVGYKAPYTKGNNCVRGNIYDKSTFEKTDMHGGWLYAK